MQPCNADRTLLLFLSADTLHSEAETPSFCPISDLGLKPPNIRYVRRKKVTTPAPETLLNCSDGCSLRDQNSFVPSDTSMTLGKMEKILF
jgi:hypothetical protein